MAEPPLYPGAPRWVKVAGLIAAGVAVLVIILLVTGIGGPHGPARHMPTGSAGDEAPAGGVTEEAIPPGDVPADRTPPMGGY